MTIVISEISRCKKCFKEKKCEQHFSFYPKTILTHILLYSRCHLSLNINNMTYINFTVTHIRLKRVPPVDVYINERCWYIIQDAIF